MRSTSLEMSRSMPADEERSPESCAAAALRTRGGVSPQNPLHALFRISATAFWRGSLEDVIVARAPAHRARAWALDVQGRLQAARVSPVAEPLQARQEYVQA